MTEFNADIFKLFDRQWGLLAAGTKGSYNAMTISWGGLGTLWGKPAATVYVKPVRYTHEFMERSDYFTVSFYPPEYREALGLLGTLSGRDGDKIAAAGLTPVFLEKAVTFKEAEAALLCKKIYRHDLELEKVPDWAAQTYYVTEEPHTLYIGQVIDILK